MREPRPGDTVWLTEFGNGPYVLVSPAKLMTLDAEIVRSDKNTSHSGKHVVENTWLVRGRLGKYHQYPSSILTTRRPNRGFLASMVVTVLPWSLATLGVLHFFWS